MIIQIKKIIQEDSISNFLTKLNEKTYTSSKMNDRADAITPLDAATLSSKAIGFKDKSHELSLNKSKRDFNTGKEEGSESNAKELFSKQRDLELNK